MNEGWIKLYRKLLDWEWYDDLNVRATFLHCLLRANFKDQTYRGQLVKRGQFITGRKKFAKEVCLSVQEVRTAWAKLESTNDLTIKTTNKGTTITVCNYEAYQEPKDKEQPAIQPSKQQTSNQQLTTIKNEKNIKNTYVALSEADYPKACTHVDEATDVALLLLKAITNFDSSHKYNYNPPSKSAFRDWVLELERGMRLDGVTKKQYEYVIKYLYSRDTELTRFWRPNIQSGPTLRGQFEQLKGKIKNEVGAHDGPQKIDPESITPAQLKNRGYWEKDQAEAYCQKKFRDPLEECRSHFKIYQLNGNEYFKPADQV